ncbi:glycosyltransferase family 4 protein [Paenibacillus sp. 2TAB26]|uniref:glycosyltransferase family 4 protein n=1 Tax=Paenibacillus sp. 2TAB26 TaxID=3233005 RepID=UPI003F979FF9
MIKTYVFVSYELAPINAGGCGVFIHYAIQELLKNNNNHIILLLDMPKHECDLYENNCKQELPNFNNLTIVCLSQLLLDESGCGEGYDNVFLQKSYRFYRGLVKLTSLYLINYVEFFDYVGIGYFSVRAKRFEGEFAQIILTIRAHCTIDLMDMEQIPNELNIHKLEMYQMEKSSIQNADFVMVPSKAWSNLYMERYGVRLENLIVSPPPVIPWNDIEYSVNEKQQDVLFYGRVFQLKGVDILVDAAVMFMLKNVSNQSLFYIVGYDGMDLSGQPYRNQLLARIPEELRNRFVFTGQLNHKELEKVIQNVRFAVFPNRIESFCYSIHELYSLGIPIISNNIPAFNDYFHHEKNSLVYNNTSLDLVSKMETLFLSSELRSKLSYPYSVINNGTFNRTYESIFEENNDDLNADKVNKYDWKCSIVLLKDEGNDISNYLSLLNHPDVDQEKCYILSLDPPGIPVLFLGEIRFAKRFDGSTDHLMSLMPYVLTCYEGDVIDPLFISVAKRIYSKSSDLRFVGCYYSGNSNISQFDLYENHNYYPYSRLTRSIVSIDDSLANLRDVFDNRMGNLGEMELINKKGYVIPRAYIEISSKFLNINKEQSVYKLHRSTKNKTWNPNILYPLIRQASVAESEIKEIYIKNNFKSFYHKLKNRTDGMDGLKGRIAVNVLRKFYFVVKKLRSKR